MPKATSGVLAILPLLLLWAHSAGASHPEPKRAKRASVPLVQGYEDCTAPNDEVFGSSMTFQACSPAVPTDTLCSLDPSKTTGLFQVIQVGSADAGTVDVRINARLNGITSCEGVILCPVVTFRLTTDACTSFDPAGCTSLVQEMQIANSIANGGCCSVSQGNCRIKTTVNTETAGLVAAGGRTGIGILSCGLRRINGSSPPTRNSFVCGLLIP